jgi:hypothetical protein
MLCQTDQALEEEAHHAEKSRIKILPSWVTQRHPRLAILSAINQALRPSAVEGGD